nr:unnamed protein product [Digitaria exilis]
MASRERWVLCCHDADRVDALPPLRLCYSVSTPPPCRSSARSCSRTPPLVPVSLFLLHAPSPEKHLLAAGVSFRLQPARRLYLTEIFQLLRGCGTHPAAVNVQRPRWRWRRVHARGATARRRPYNSEDRANRLVFMRYCYCLAIWEGSPGNHRRHACGLMHQMGLEAMEVPTCRSVPCTYLEWSGGDPIQPSPTPAAALQQCRVRVQDPAPEEYLHVVGRWMMIGRREKSTGPTRLGLKWLQLFPPKPKKATVGPASKRAGGCGPLLNTPPALNSHRLLLRPAYRSLSPLVSPLLVVAPTDLSLSSTRRQPRGRERGLRLVIHCSLLPQSTLFIRERERERGGRELMAPAQPRRNKRRPDRSTPPSPFSFFFLAPPPDPPPELLAESKQSGLRSKQSEEASEMDFGDDVMDGSDGQRRKKRYHRHTPRQIQQLEAYVLISPLP